MQRTDLIHSLAIVLSLFCIQGAGAEKALERPQISESIVMFYYPDIAPARAFYENTLGLDPSFEDTWVSIYKIAPTASLGIVQEGSGVFHKANANSAVMLSIVSSDVDAWYERLKAVPGVRFEHELLNHKEAPIRSFLIRDPGGYTIEFFQWLDR